MKVITVNRLLDGGVGYIGPAGSTVHSVLQAMVFADDASAEAALNAVARRVTEFASAYLIEVENHRPSGRARLRETIRQSGPTVYDFKRGAAA
jgi:hypothetical protein